MPWTPIIEQQNRQASGLVQVIAVFSDGVNTVRYEALVTSVEQLKQTLAAKKAELDASDAVLALPKGAINITLTPTAPTRDALLAQLDALDKRIATLKAISASTTAEDAQRTALVTQIKAL